MRVVLPAAVALAQTALERLGYEREQSEVIAAHLIDCELRGLEYAGLARILSIADRLRTTGFAPEPITVTRESPVIGSFA